MADVKCQKCGDSGWKPNIDANGNRVWLPLMNDALPCECGALARNYKREREMLAGNAEYWSWFPISPCGVAIPDGAQEHE